MDPTPWVEPLWDAPWSWIRFLILLAGTILLTIGFVIWNVMTSDRPEDTTAASRESMSRRSRREAELNARRLEADAGRVEKITPDLS